MAIKRDNPYGAFNFKVEFADVKDVRAQLAGSRVAELSRVLLIAGHGFAAVERCRRHTPAGRTVHHEAGTAEAIEVLQ